MPYSNEPSPQPQQPRRRNSFGVMYSPDKEAERHVRRFELAVAIGMTRIEGELRELFS